MTWVDVCGLCVRMRTCVCAWRIRGGKERRPVSGLKYVGVDVDVCVCVCGARLSESWG
jgi:hypothetical protein